MKTIRAESFAEKAAAYYVRIQGMAVKHHIPHEQEFDERDETDARYIVIFDDVLPVATGRIYPAGDGCVQFGRLVVLPEYRHRGLGTEVVKAAEDWARELGYSRMILESRDNKTEFYEKIGYRGDKSKIIYCEPFNCVYMEKDL